MMIFPPSSGSSHERSARAASHRRARSALWPARRRLLPIALLLGTQLGSAAGAALASAAVVSGASEGVRAFGITLIAASVICALIVALRLISSIRHLHDGATRDALTGLLNRGELMRRLDARLDERRSPLFDGASATVLVALDLDRFKPINDRFGHASGDVVLSRIASRLQRLLRRERLIGRVGGDEFVFAVDLAPDEDPLAFVRRIREALVARPIRAGGVCHRIGVTAGLARAVGGETAEALIERADLALIGGKVRGRNRCYVAPPPRHMAEPSPPRSEGVRAPTSHRELGRGRGFGEDIVPMPAGREPSRGFGELP